MPADCFFLNCSLCLLVDLKPKVVSDTYQHLFIQHINKFFTLLGVCLLVTLKACLIQHVLSVLIKITYLPDMHFVSGYDIGRGL